MEQANLQRSVIGDGDMVLPAALGGHLHVRTGLADNLVIQPVQRTNNSGPLQSRGIFMPRALHPSRSAAE